MLCSPLRRASINLSLWSTGRVSFHGMPALVAATPAGVTHAPGLFPHLSAQSVHRMGPMGEERWLEIVLLDEDDQPVVGERCELTGPDGASLGPFTTDSQGRVMLDGIEAGNYDVAFSKLHDDAWEAA
jgi:hypothetical protein